MRELSQSDNISIIITEYLNGKTLNQIVNETGISKGKVHYSIKNWKNKVGIPNVEEVRDFTVLVRKSGMSIKQCAQGFRILQLMKNLGIGEHGKDDQYEDDVTNEISSFLNIVHQRCKNLGITPTIVPLWINDLLDCYTHNYNNKDSNNDFILHSSKILPYSDSNLTINGMDSDSQVKQEPSSSFSETKIPFISQVSNAIVQKKIECKKLEKYRMDLKEKLDDLELQVDQARNNLDQISQNEKFVMSYFDWFYKLKKELRDNYDVKIEDNFKSFAQLINDFKIHDFDVYEIINEYRKALSLRLEIKTNEEKIYILQNQNIVLNNSVLSLQSQVNMHKQTLYTFSELEAMKFGMNELQQLWYTVLEIAEANNIPRDQAVSKFLKDIEEQYNRKLGFEDKVKEKINEFVQLNNKINDKRLILQLTPFIGTSLYNLFQNGVSEQNIIGISQLAQEYKNNGFPIDVDIFYGEDNKDKDKNGLDATSFEFWKLFTDELKRYGGIKLAIKEQSNILDGIKQEINNSNKQKQDLLTYCHLAISLINTVNNKISYFKGLVDYFNTDMCVKKIKFSSFMSSPILILIINIKLDNKGQEEEGKDTEESQK